MKAVGCLPEGYREIYSVDLQKNKKMSVCVNLLATILAVCMIVPMCFVVPLTIVLDEMSMKDCFIKCAALFGLMVLYTVLHEFVHGIAMKLCGTKKVRYGFTGLYAFAASEDYYGKRAYIFIALAPIVLWGAALAVVNPLVPTDWFWVVYLIQVMNISGAAGDLFVTVKFSRLPGDILVRDYGVKMEVFSAS